MQLNDQQQALIDILMRQNDYITAHKLSEVTNTSTKTIYRNVRSINDSSESGDVIEAARGRGYRLNYDRYIYERNTSVDNTLDYSPIERRNRILLELLFNAPFDLNVDRLYEHYYVSETVIENDISLMNKLALSFGLVLKHRYRRLSITGPEPNIRQAIRNTINKGDLMDKESIDDFIDDFHELSSFDERFLIAQLEYLERSLKLTIPYPYNINIFSHLYILMSRFREGKVVDDPEQNRLTADQKALTERNPKFAEVAREIIGKIGRYLNTTLPAIEDFYLLQYMVSMRYDRELPSTNHEDKLVDQLVVFYVDGFDFNGRAVDRTALVADLRNHIKPMVNRLKNGISVANHLLKEIGSEYPDELAQVKQLSSEVQTKFALPAAISADESGFITLYFAKYLEQAKPAKRILIMCASGVGTSQLIWVKVQKAFPDLDVVAVVSKDGYLKHAADYGHIDLIITTVNVTPADETSVVMVSAMFTKADRDQVANWIERRDS